jgi:ligand-binding sensor domain-containing protein/two-component sensor histidine kinase
MAKKFSQSFLFSHLVLILVVLCLHIKLTLALNPQTPLSRYSYHTWQPNDGLPRASILSITQTKDGYLWLATESGLVRFDGQSFTIFDTSTTKELEPEGGTYELWPSKDGGLWISVDSTNVVRMTNGTFTSYPLGVQFHKPIKALYEDPKGHLWIGTPGAGLAKMMNGNLEFFNLKTGLTNNFVTAITGSRTGIIWVGTRNGLNAIKDGTLISYGIKDGFLGQAVNALVEDQTGNLWIGTNGGGLYQYKGGKFIKQGEGEGLSYIDAIGLDSQDNLWIASRQRGLTRFKDGHFVSIDSESPLKDSQIQSIFEDREGSLWLGTQKGSLVKIIDNNVYLISDKSVWGDDSVRAVHEEEDGSLWIASKQGLRLVKGGEIKKYENSDGLPDNNVLALLKSRQGNFWIGTLGRGVAKLSDGKISVLGMDEGIGEVTSLGEACDGSLWIGSSTPNSKLTRLKDGKFTSYDLPKEIKAKYFRAMQVDRKCNLWIGTSAGLVKFKDEEFTVYTTQHGLLDNNVQALYESMNGDLWIGTMRGGLNRLRDGKITSYTTEQGLYKNAVSQVQEDDNGYLWIGHREGIYKILKSEFDEIDNAKRKRLNCDNFIMPTDLEFVECTVGGRYSRWSSDKSKLIFPTTDGIVVIDQKDQKVNRLPPPVIIEWFTADNKRYDHTKTSNIPAGKGDIKVKYTALSLAVPERVKFKYILEGFDTDWVDPGNSRSVRYPNLPPGNYKFKVIASNNDGIWNEEGATLSFNIAPYFYQTYWFYGLCASLIALIGWAVHNFRVRQMQVQYAAVEKERARIAREIHDTIIQGIVGISTHVELLASGLNKSSQPPKELLDQLRLTIRHSLDEARESIWNLRSSTLKGGGLASALHDSIQQIVLGTTIQAKVQVYGSPQRLPDTVENHLLRISQEACRNAVKHSKADNIQVELHYDIEYVRLLILDNGIGFNQQDGGLSRKDGWGLVNMRERVDQLGGKIFIHSSQDDGTIIEVEIPIN